MRQNLKVWFGKSNCLTGITFTNLRPVDTELGKDVNNMMDSNEAITVEL